ncbi:hypothetical protein ACX801_18315 [Arthrobacter bambusae]
MPVHTLEALIMRVTPQVNITDGTGTTIPVKTVAEARKVLASTARLNGGPITVKQHGYDSASSAEGAALVIHTNGVVDEQENTGPAPCWDVEYHSWVVDVEHEGSYNVPGVTTAIGDARMLATRLNRPVLVQVADIRPDNGSGAHTLIEPEEPAPHGADVVEHIEADEAKSDSATVCTPGPKYLEQTDPSAEQDPTPPVEDGAEELVDDGGEPDRDGGPPATPTRRKGRRILLVSIAAAVLLAGGAATTAAFIKGPETPMPPNAASRSLWQVGTAPRDVSLAADGVLVTAGAGKAEAYSLMDGKSLGTGDLPEGRPRVIAGTGRVFAFVAGTDGTSAGFVASPEGVKNFSGVKGTLVARGPDPFFLTGSGTDQKALVWDGSTWKPVTPPEAGMAPVAASNAGVMWLGASGRLVSPNGTTTPAAPSPGAKTAGWVWADDKSVAVVWDTPKGRVLAVHSLTDGKITGQSPANVDEFRKDGDLVVFGTQVFSFDSGSPSVTESCADPVPAAGLIWCRTESTWTAKNARPLAPGETPVPSPADLVVTASSTGFTAYPRDAMKTDQTPQEK